MKHAVTLKEVWNAARTTRSAKRFVKEFARDEDGAFIIFSLFMFVLMLLTAGMALDLMRYETHRARLQGTLDRAVLAAADLDQTLSP
ncbi:MAG: Tad domain-containing protein, partial [Paracoccaceae bacterium]|nr:Tad domain-containing protein [Paracoccaceae bacterium]